jgi:hypothetical protein
MRRMRQCALRVLCRLCRFVSLPFAVIEAGIMPFV